MMTTTTTRRRRVQQRAALKQIVLDSSQYRYVNEDYLQTIPISIRDTDEQETIYDYEPHSSGNRYYDDPDKAPFEEAFDDGKYGGRSNETTSTKHITRLVIKNCEQLLALSYYDEGEDDNEFEVDGESEREGVESEDVSEDKTDEGEVERESESTQQYDNHHDYSGLLAVLREIYIAPLEPWSDSEDDEAEEGDEGEGHSTEVAERPEASDDDDDTVTGTLSKEDRHLLSMLQKTINLEVDCEEWDPICSSYHDGKCLSVCLLSLLLAFPNVKALRIKHLILSVDGSLFANFPNPRPSSSFPQPAITVASHLEVLSLEHCGGLHPSDLPFLTDCAIEHAVIPNLRHLQCYYCNGMSYPSVVAASEALNLDFDRFELSGWCWPQEAVNSKNECIHY